MYPDMSKVRPSSSCPHKDRALLWSNMRPIGDICHDPQTIMPSSEMVPMVGFIF